MSNERELDQVLAALQADELDQLSPEQVERLAAHLNSHPHDAQRLARVAPAVSPALRDLESLPDEHAWKRVWENVDEATPAGPITSPAQHQARVLRLWQSVAAVAACLVLAGLWTLKQPPPATNPSPAGWGFDLAGEVEIQQLEVFGGDTPFLVHTADDSDATVIWVLEDET